MTFALRWPLHPAPNEGEALSSWLNRVASCYGMFADDLIFAECGSNKPEELDIASPPEFIKTLSQRSGLSVDQIYCMTISAYIPWLLDSLDGKLQNSLEEYAFQFSVIIQKNKRKVRSFNDWCAWMPAKFIHRACPKCWSDTPDQSVRLAWKLPLMLSGPTHGCWLQFYWGIGGRSVGWEGTERTASDAIIAMDRYTLQALETGYVDLPRRKIHAGIWFRLLRTILDELSTPLSQCGNNAKVLRRVWETCGHPVRAGLLLWRPFEFMKVSTQLQMLEAAATAIQMMEEKSITPFGEMAGLFVKSLKQNGRMGIRPSA